MVLVYKDKDVEIHLREHKLYEDDHMRSQFLPPGYKVMQLPSYPNLIADQRLFQNTFGHGDLPYPQIPSAEVRERRLKLVSEEYTEFESAHEVIEQLSCLDPDDPVLPELTPAALAQLADAIADSIYVLLGTAFEYGIPIAEVWREVQRANMQKLWTANELNTLYDSSSDPQLKPEHKGWGWKIARPYPGPRNPDSDQLHRAWIVINEYGKVMKPPGFRPPDIEAIIRKAYHDKANPSQTPPDQQARRDEWNKALTEEDKARGYPYPSTPADPIPFPTAGEVEWAKTILTAHYKFDGEEVLDSIIEAHQTGPDIEY